MKFIDIFNLSTRMFKARTSRTLLTILGMSIGIGAILFLFSLGYGLQNTLLERITTSDSLLTLDIAEAKSGVVSLNDEMLEEIKNIEGVDDMIPAAQLTAQAKLDELSADVVALATRPSFLKLSGVKIKKEESLNDENVNEIVITSAVAQVFGKSPEEMLGKEMDLKFFVLKEGEAVDELKSNFEIFEPNIKHVVSKIINGEENIIYVNLISLEGINIDKYSQLKVKCQDSDVMSTVRDNILDKGLLVSSLSETVDQANQIFKVIQIILLLFGIIALIVSAIGMFNTMTIALLERTEEIGIMKSIGASDLAISMMFIMEATIMGFLGGLMGIAIGLLGGEVFNWIINMIASRFGGESVDLFDSPMWFILTIVVFSAIVGFITGVTPARRASKIDPLDALRYK